MGLNRFYMSTSLALDSAVVTYHKSYEQDF